MTTYKHKQRLINVEQARDLLNEFVTLLTDLNCDRIVNVTQAERKIERQMYEAIKLLHEAE